ncbi:MAG: acyl-CoA dehydrogenase family protein, partial [Clostridia bacterium]|nr:acyl-CoA dehydrogenase family protein [Clostridia bacterium]
MFSFLMTEEQKALQKEVQDFVGSVDKQLILDMDENKVQYPTEYLKEAARRNLLGLRFPKEYGGRGLGWTSEIIALEDIGMLGSALACLYSLPSIVG